ncbi:MAG: hypothetical protein KDA93_03725 [Planctomycetaceae bacterium]|nr:hypothetical protein [Planctomycetaceae bacterium]
MWDDRAVRFTNYRMAAGRIGLMVVMVALLGGVGALFLIDEHGSIPIGVGLIAFSLPFLWYAFTVPLSVTIGEVLSVRYLWGRRDHLLSDIESITTGVMKSRLRKQIGSPTSVGSHSYKAVIIETRMGRKIWLMGDRQQAEDMQAAIDQRQDSEGVDS